MGFEGWYARECRVIWDDLHVYRKIVEEERKIFKIRDELWDISGEFDFRNHVYGIHFFLPAENYARRSTGESRAKGMSKHVDVVGKHYEGVGFPR